MEFHKCAFIPTPNTTMRLRFATKCVGQMEEILKIFRRGTIAI